tara:strand:- start:199 stop:489 length:291 start_codon:yes stop_codon:yes gene_type:complete
MAPFKMKGFSGFGNSPMKQDSKKTFERIQKMKKQAKKFVKNLKAKNVVTAGGKRLSGVLGLMSGGSLSATAGNVGKKSTGQQIKDLLKKHKLKGGK